MSESVVSRSSNAELFYKYMGFGPHTRLSLFMLFCHKAIFFSHRRVLNDPTDCTPHLFNELDEDGAVIWIEKILDRDRSLSDQEKQEARSILDRYSGKNKADKAEQPIKSLGRGLLGSFARSPIDFISAYMRRNVSDARVFSMSKTWDEPRMWAHYASSHSGFCLELSGLDKAPNGIIFDQVDYTTRRPRISATDICLSATGGNEEIRREVYSRSYLQKSLGWDSELEYRLILPADTDVSDRVVLSLPEGTYLRCPEIKVNSVIFGLNATQADRDLFEEHFFRFFESDRPSTFKIRQTDKSYKLEASLWMEKGNQQSEIREWLFSRAIAPTTELDIDLQSIKAFSDWVPEVEVRNSEESEK